MRTSIAGLAAALALTGLAGTAWAQPVQVVELFTSQGCSSCPPADAAVAKISARPEILALSFGVTYWDNLGWKDTFAKPAYTERQWDYARGFRRAQVATPQVVVNGRTDTIGGSVAEIDAALKRAALAAGPGVTLTSTVAVVSGAARARPADVWLVRYDPRVVQVPVKRGENTGKTLPIKNAVKALTRLGEWTGGQKSFDLPPGPANLSSAILVQSGPGGPILAAAKG